MYRRKVNHPNFLPFKRKFINNIIINTIRKTGADGKMNETDKKENCRYDIIIKRIPIKKNDPEIIRKAKNAINNCVNSYKEWFRKLIDNGKEDPEFRTVCEENLSNIEKSLNQQLKILIEIKGSILEDEKVNQIGKDSQIIMDPLPNVKDTP